MSINVSWENQSKTAVQVTLQRGWSWDELYQAIEQADALITSVPHRVDLIIDISHAGGLPRDFMSAAGDIFEQGEARANEGRKIVVGANMLIRMAYSGFQKVYGHKLKDRPFLFANDLEEAHTILSSS